MKYYTIFLLLIFSAPILAQQSEIKGVISIHNSEYETGKRQYVINAQVEDDIERANAQLSDAIGYFKLIYKGVPEKTTIQLIVKKKDLQVVNIDGLSAVTGQRDVIRLSMAKPDKIAEYRRQIYKVGKTEAEKNLAAQLKKKGEQIETLQKDAIKNKTDIGNLQKEYAELQAFASKIEEQAQDLARRYAPVNLDDAAPLYRESFRLFQQGELGKALQILRGANLVNQANKILAEEHAISEAQRELIKRDSIKEQRKKDLIQVLGLKADIHKGRLEWDSVLFCLELRVNLDSINVHNIWVLAHFLSAQNKIHDAIPYFEKALVLTKSPELKATFLTNLGNNYYANQKMPQAEAAYLEALKIQRQLVDKNPDVLLPQLAGTLNNLGVYYSNNQKMAQAETAYVEALQIRRQLAEKNSDLFLSYVAATFSNLGVFYEVNQKGLQAEATYLEALKIYRQLADKNSDDFLRDMANTLNNLGAYYSDNQKMPQAEAAYLEALKIRRQLADKNPEAFLSYVATTLNNLGAYYSDNQNMLQAEAAYLEALKIRRQLADKNPKAFLSYVATTLNNLGDFFKTSHHYKTALEHYEEALHIHEAAILNNGMHQFEDWKRVLFNINIVKDSFLLIKDYRNVSYTSRLLAESCDKLKKVDETIKSWAISEYGNLSWWALFIKDYALSERAALRCLELDNTQEWVLTNLGHSQLLRGQYAAAKATYEKLKGKKHNEGKDYKQVLLDDLNALQLEGVTHRDFDQARAIIERW